MKALPLSPEKAAETEGLKKREMPDRGKKRVSFP